MNQLSIAALGLGAAFLLSKRGAQAAPPTAPAPSPQLPAAPAARPPSPFDAPADDARDVIDLGPQAIVPPSTSPGKDPYVQPGAAPAVAPRVEPKVTPEPKAPVIPKAQVTRGANIVPVTTQPRIT